MTDIASLNLGGSCNTLISFLRFDRFDLSKFDM